MKCVRVEVKNRVGIKEQWFPSTGQCDEKVVGKFAVYIENTSLKGHLSRKVALVPLCRKHVKELEKDWE